MKSSSGCNLEWSIGARGMPHRPKRYRLYIDESVAHVYENLLDASSRFLARVGVWMEQSVHDVAPSASRFGYNPAMSERSNRRWLRFAFSLRTLFVVMTLFCLWLGWQRQIVNERLEVVRWTQAEHALPSQHRDGDIMLVCSEDFDWPLPWIRRQLGDAPYHWACLWPARAEDRARIFSAFPDIKSLEYHAQSNYFLPVD